MDGDNQKVAAARDFERHNEEVAKVWDAYHVGSPVRVPVIFGINPRFTLLDPALNPRRITFEEYSKDPAVMLDVQLKFFEWVRTNVPQDAEMGLPEEWAAYVDFQNYYEAGFLGAQVYFPEGSVPVARPILDDERKNLLLDRGLPKMSDCPLWVKAVEMFEYLKKKREEGFEFRGRPLGRARLPGTGTDGPFTLLMSLRGTEALLDMYVEPDYFHAMMEYLTEFALICIRETRKAAGLPEKDRQFYFADDSIELLSVADYKRFILPYHRRIFDELGGQAQPGMHICGDVQRHFPVLIDEFDIGSFDTGFPIDWETLRDEVGDDTEIYGGPHVEILRRGTPGEVRAEAKRILESGIMRGGRFVLREANNLPPLTPVENLEAMYQAAARFGVY